MTNTDKERERDKQLIANLEKETSEQADEIERLMAEVENWKLWAKSHPEWQDQGPQSDAEPVRIVHDDAFGWGVLFEGKPIKCLFNSKEEAVAWVGIALAQSDAKPQETWNKQLPGPDSIQHELGECPTQSEPAQPQTLRDAAENLLIAIGMGWDIEGCVENLRAALARSDAEPKYDRAGATRADAEMLDALTLLSQSGGVPQSDAEPVAWRWRDNRYSLEQYGGRWQGPTGDPNEARWRSGLSKYTVEPLYAMRGSCCSHTGS